MSHVEFDQQALLIADQIPSLPEADRIAAACRGSGNPAALSWLAEGLRLDGSTTVIDLGAGLGGPSAGLTPQRVIEILTSGGVATIATVTGRDRTLESAHMTIRRYRDAGAIAIQRSSVVSAQHGPRSSAHLDYVDNTGRLAGASARRADGGDRFGQRRPKCRRVGLTERRRRRRRAKGDLRRVR